MGNSINTTFWRKFEVKKFIKILKIEIKAISKCPVTYYGVIVIKTTQPSSIFFYPKIFISDILFNTSFSLITFD